ncbi:MAG: dUTP diphosphatase [Cetobacterium sp.]
MIIDFEYALDEQKSFLEHLEVKKGMKCPKHSFNVPTWLILALLTELMEVANEKKCFKWWDKTPVNEKKVLTELSDLLSHIANLANILEVGLTSDIEQVQTTAVETTFIRLAYQFTTLTYKKTFARRTLKNRIVPLFVELVYSLGFSLEELKNEYSNKMNENYMRF